MLQYILVVFFASVSFAQLDPDAMPSEWLPEQFPNPMTNPQACGLRNKPGYVCDPNRLLTQKERDTLNWLMEGMVKNDTRCPCSVWDCEERNRGYFVGFAIMKKMVIPTRKMTPLDQAEVFAHYLETSHWNFGKCEEAIIVLYSQDDEVLQFQASKTSGVILTDEVARAIGNKVAYNFQNNEPAHGFFEISLLLRDVMNRNTMYALAPNVMALHGGASFITIAVSTLIMTLTAIFIMS